MSGTRLRLRYAGRCRRCDRALAAGDEAIWFKAERSVECIACAAATEASLHDALPADPFDLGREVDRGEAGRNLVNEMRRKGGRMREDFAKGIEGEHAVAAALERLPLSRVLHSRTKPGGGDIDHLVVVPSGVWVVDAKYRSGKVVLPLTGTIDDLRIGGRRVDKLVAGVRRQADAVREVVDGCPVFAALCIVGAQWDTWRNKATFEGGLIAHRKALVDHIAKARVVLDRPEDRYAVARRLEAAFPAL